MREAWQQEADTKSARTCQAMHPKRLIDLMDVLGVLLMKTPGIPEGAAPRQDRSLSKGSVCVCVCVYTQINIQLRHNQNQVSNWSIQNHVENREGSRNYFWLGLPLTNLHLPGF